MSDPIIDPAHAIPAASALRRSRFRWRIVAFVALVVAILAVAGRYATEFGLSGDQIARVVIDGTITTDPNRLKVLERLGEDASVKAVVLAINSPGGTTAGGEELYEAIGKLRAKKPVVAYIKELGASAAYMTAIAADRIFARRLSIVASIGVLFQTYNAGKLLETIGIGSDKVASGPLKAEPALDHPMTPEVRASLQSLVDDSFSWFVDVVAERRGLTRAQVLPLADGRVMTGNQGIANRLIDEVGGEAEAIDWLAKAKGIKAGLPVVTWYPTGGADWTSLGRWIGGQARAALGLPAEPVVLDGLVSLWQAQ
ncbi:MAG TPA: signal peptide peptidase SppA [Hypericibacter adhaerens]|uniref:signal peptide peptidase SppA n=1 Tax=Hypericibacter adhaerens TaxID=2602016 RepID=UPI002D00AA0E|nr:signal peptide peptidase SppA [Hypericibacter adhaerens]HWA44001.1 signal peptide peptidase SppA [Hypericibacter adhaerens]